MTIDFGVHVEKYHILREKNLLIEYLDLASSLGVNELREKL